MNPLLVLTTDLDFGSWTRAELIEAQKLVAAELEKSPPLDPLAYEGKFSDLSDEVAGKLEDYAQRVASGDLSPAQFRRSMERTIRSAYSQSYRYGASSVVGRTTLTDDDLSTIRDYLGDEFDYLDRFARQIKERIADPEVDAFSEDYLKNRTSLYADALRGLYWEGKTSRYDDENWEAYYEAEDDGSTCDECAAAAAGSPYAPSECPMPGAETCAGLDRCRCQIRYEQVDAAAADEETA